MKMKCKDNKRHWWKDGWICEKCGLCKTCGDCAKYGCGENKPPKDGTMIIAEFKNYPTPIVACWNGADEKWSAAVPHVEPVNGAWNDWYFETEQFEDSDLVDWREI